MKTKQKFITSLTLILMLTITQTARARSGITLLLPSDARAFGMAEAYVAESGRPGCMYYNTAGLGYIKHGRQYVNVSYLSGITNDSFGVTGYCKSMKKWVISGGIKYYNAGMMNLYSKNIQKTDSVVSQKDYLVSLGLARREVFNWTLYRAVSYGIRFKMLNSTLIEKYSAQSLSADIGVLMVSKKRSIGITMGNLGQKMTYNEEGDALPRYYSFGFSTKLYTINKLNIIFNVDLLSYDDVSGKTNFGFSSEITPQFELRCGYRMGYDLDSLTFGFGYKIKEKCQFDYGMSLMGILGQRHLISVSYRLK